MCARGRARREARGAYTACRAARTTVARLALRNHTIAADGQVRDRGCEGRAQGDACRRCPRRSDSVLCGCACAPAVQRKGPRTPGPARTGTVERDVLQRVPQHAMVICVLPHAPAPQHCRCCRQQRVHRIPVHHCVLKDFLFLFLDTAAVLFADAAVFLTAAVVLTAVVSEKDRVECAGWWGGVHVVHGACSTGARTDGTEGVLSETAR